MLLKWEKSLTSFVNRYKVTVGNETKYTTGFLPEIVWNSLLMPLTKYRVSITAVSYGYTTNYPSYGSKESPPYVIFIYTTDSTILYHDYISYYSLKCNFIYSNGHEYTYKQMIMIYITFDIFDVFFYCFFKKYKPHYYINQIDFKGNGFKYFLINHM